jgi:hypothetical protein
MYLSHAKSNASLALLRLKSTARGMVLAAGLCGSGLHAQVIVHDPIATFDSHADSALQYAKQGAQYLKQLQEYATQLQQYAQLLSSIEGFTSGMSLVPNQLTHVTDSDSLVQGKCSGVSGINGLVSTIMNSMGSLMNQSITQTQQMLCKQIVLKQIDKYNETVDMLNKIQGFSAQYQHLEQVAHGITTFADSNRSNGDQLQYSGAVQTEMANWKTNMTVDDSVIKTLKDQQSILGHIALKGSNTVLGNVVQATTFAAAFQ